MAAGAAVIMAAVVFATESAATVCIASPNGASTPLSIIRYAIRRSRFASAGIKLPPSRYIFCNGNVSAMADAAPIHLQRGADLVPARASPRILGASQCPSARCVGAAPV